MSITTTPTPAPPTEEGGFLARFRRQRDTTPVEMLDFFSPSAAVMARPANPIARNTVLVIASLVASICVLFWVCTIDRQVQAGGHIVSITPETVIQPLNPGVVTSIAVSEGDIVRKGQLLAQLDPTYAAADDSAARDMRDRYASEVDRLTAELHQVPYRPKVLTPGALIQEGIFAQDAAARDAELRYYKGQIDAERAVQASAEANVRQYAKETGVAVDAEKIYEQLEKDQVGSVLNALTAQTTRLEAERFVLTNIDAARQAQESIKSLQGQLDNYNQNYFITTSQNLTDDSVSLATAVDQVEHAALNYKLIDLRAQEDSIVLSVAPISVGSVISAGQTFFTLVPVNAPLEVDAQIPGNESGFVAVGQEAQIQFQTFPFTAFGEARGSVRFMSPDSFNTSSTGATSTTSAGTTSNAVFTGQTPNSAYYYEARLTIDRLKMKNLPQDFRIIPGMPVGVAISVGSRNIWEYLVERLLPIWYEGMREPI